MASREKAGGTSKSPGAGSGDPRVAVLMGSQSDWEIMRAAVEALEGLGVVCDVRVISAHRTPERHHTYVTGAEERGIEVFICGAGFAAHLAGVTAALTPLPVLGVPLDSSPLDGVDALLSTVQMPGGIPVASFRESASPGPRTPVSLPARSWRRRDPKVRKQARRLCARSRPRRCPTRLSSRHF